eukprot:CCRYP_002420-RA/>CCRYP_002420-RA protein AED:0.03 eAED:0.03 QI:101/1/1/1/1/1/2/149/327
MHRQSTITLSVLFVAASIIVTSKWRAAAFSFLLPARINYRRAAIKNCFHRETTLHPSRDGAGNEYDAILVSDGEVLGNIEVPIEPPRNTQQAELLKSQLYQLAASYDRGFSATPRARQEANNIIQKLASINPTNDASRGIDGGVDDRTDVPLRAIWRMIWTTALDVVSLGASPLAAPSAIYQVITDPPIAKNIIDFIPRAQSFFPSTIAPPSLLRAEVTTRASSRKGNTNRVGLVFEGVKLQPIELLGNKVDNLPPLSIDLTWPQNTFDQIAPYIPGIGSIAASNSKDDTDRPGYFDVEYLDDELLVIRQQAPGGVFALIKVDNFDP